MYKQKNGPMMRAGYNKEAVSPFKYENPVDPKTGKPKPVKAVESVTSAFGSRPKSVQPFGTFAPSGRGSGAFVSDVKRSARKIYSAVTGNDPSEAPNWMQNK